MKKMDYIFAIAIIICSFGLWIVAFIFHQTGEYIEVSLDNQVIGRYSLIQNGEYPIRISDTEYNILVVQDGRAAISEASCPDRLCVRQHAIMRTGESIICLPHKLVFRVVGNSGSARELDAIAN